MKGWMRAAAALISPVLVLLTSAGIPLGEGPAQRPDGVQAAEPGGGARTEGPRAIYLHCNISEQSVRLDSSPSDQLAALTGIVTVDHITVLVVDVALSCSVDLGWSSSIQPTEMSFNAPGSLPFTVNVTVPGGTQNRTAVLTVRAVSTVQGIPSDSDQDTASVEVGAGGGGTPVVPPQNRTAAGGAGVRLLNMPALVTLVSLAAVIGSWLALRLRRPKRAPAREAPAPARSDTKNSEKKEGEEKRGEKLRPST